MTAAFRCATCGQIHADLPKTFGSAAPLAWYELDFSEREARAVLSSDQCIIDEKQFFVLGRLPVPVHGETTPLTWLVWVSVSEESFGKMDELWNAAGRESELPYFGWLNTALPGYPSTINLKCHVRTQPVGQRPLIELEPTAHPLAVDQREGIDPARLRMIVEAALHTAGLNAT